MTENKNNNSFEKILEKIQYIQDHDYEINMKDIFPDGLPEELYYFYLNDGPAKLKEKFGGIPPELKERYPNGFPEEVKALFRGKTPVEIIQLFRNGVPEPIKQLFPNGVPESLKERYRNFPEEIKTLLKPQN